MHFNTLQLDHIGIRVTELERAEAFYAKLGFNGVSAETPAQP